MQRSVGLRRSSDVTRRASVGPPYGVSGARLTGASLIEGKRRGEKFVVGTCAWRRAGRAGLFK